ncbi:hypothetical protein SAMN05216238_106200 [Lentibacillus persicus]|uniref:Uncharacterized protein n=1 Tax=Lentibacillus persicus TaxID=640948 RepID=A0A1I1WP56_9BACI|nr:hypothetical protein [Lentibacillus persicus]SFD96761.1 hypothetical protein SAMN05216238_106200 [Lentibacillus persicus]
MSEKKYDELAVKVRQHEEAIAQLLEIVAVTNRRLSELDGNHDEPLNPYSFT